MMLVSCVLISYNQEDTIIQALESIFSQTYSNYEVIISDDCSADKTFSLIHNFINSLSEEFRGRITHLNQNASNLGISRHVEVALSKAQGELVALFAGDDISLSNRLEFAVPFFEDELVMSYTSNVSLLFPDDSIKTIHDRNLHSAIYSLDDFVKLFGTKNQVIFNGCSAIYRRNVLTRLSERPIDVEDITLMFHSLILGKLVCDQRISVQYRVGNSQQATSKMGFISRLIVIDHYAGLLLENKVPICYLKSLIVPAIYKEFLHLRLSFVSVLGLCFLL
jgi:glycosyltransferase involved in cell wall biosynthesis